MNETEIGKDARIPLFERLKSRCSRMELETKRGVTQSDVIKLLENMEGEGKTGGIDFLDSRPVPSGHEIDFTSAGRNQSPREIMNYIERNFYQSEGFYRIYNDKKSGKEYHETELTRTNDNSMGSLHMRW